MSATSLNPLAVARDLKAAGIEAGHAEAIAEAMRAAATADRTDLATKADVAALKGEVAAVKVDVAALKGEVAAVKVDVAALKGDVAALKGDVAALKGDVVAVKADVAALRWMFGFLAALNLAMAAKLFGLV